MKYKHVAFRNSQPLLCVCVCVAMNGHPECLRLLMSTNDQHINVDVQDTNGQ